MEIQVADVIASGIHDAKNRLFQAQTLLDQAEHDHGPQIAEAQLAIKGAVSRLSRTLVAYRLAIDQQPLAIIPIAVEELVADALMMVRSQFERAGTALHIEVGFKGEWPLDRTLMTDILVNALQNACRYANSAARLDVRAQAEHLHISVNDDGSGYSEAVPESLTRGGHGNGLFIGRRILQLHERKGVYGKLTLKNGGPLGGALFECVLP